MKSIRHFLALFLFPLTILFGQDQEKIDSLLKVYNNLEDGIPKIKTLEHLYYSEIYNNPEKGLDYAQKGLKLSSSLSNWSGIGVAYYHIGVYHKLTSKLDSALRYYNKSLEVWEKHPDTKLKATTLSSIAGIEFENGNIDEAIVIEEKVNAINKENGFWLNYGVGLGSVGDMYSSKGNYKIAYEKSIAALEVLDTVPEEPWRDADIMRQIGNIEYSRGNYKSALEYLNKALQVYIETEDNIYIGHTYVDIGSVEHELKNYQGAIGNFEKGLSIGKQIDVIDMQANSLANMGMTYTLMGFPDKAVSYLEKAIKLNRTNNSVSNLISSLGEMGNALRVKGDADKAIPYLNESVKLADSTGILNLKKLALFYRSEAYQATNEYPNALLDMQEYIKINDSIFNKVKSQQIEELKTIYETEKKEAAIALQEEEIKTLNEKARADKLTKGLYAGGAISGIALSGLLFFGFRQRMKKNKIAREKQEAIYQQEIAHKKKELTSQTLHLVQKNTFIQELMENLEKIKNSPEKFKMEFRRIVMLLKKENASDKDWEVFKTYFADVHNDFDQKLRTLYADISEKEIRLAAFLRMNLTTKEIAATLNVLPDSILKSKYRLKKKLNLDKETDLTGFLNTL